MAAPMAVAIPPAKAGLTEVVVPVVAVPVGVAHPMDVLVVDAPEVMTTWTGAFRTGRTTAI